MLKRIVACTLVAAGLSSGATLATHRPARHAVNRNDPTQCAWLLKHDTDALPKLPSVDCPTRKTTTTSHALRV